MSLTFTGLTSRRPSRGAPSKYDQQNFDGPFEISPGIRPAEAYYPWKYLPVLRKDVSKEDYIVINKGTIVSAITMMNPHDPDDTTGAVGIGMMEGPGLSTEPITFTMAALDTAQTFVHNLGNTDYTVVYYDNGVDMTSTATIVKSAMSLSVTYTGAATADTVVVTPVGLSMQSFRDQRLDDGTMVYVDYRDSYYGIGDHVSGFLVPANGGTHSCLHCSALDVTAGTFSYEESDGLADADTDHHIPANIPIGVAMQPMYQDIRGRYNSYELDGYYGILTEGYVEVPFINTNDYADTFVATGSRYITDTSAGTLFDGAAATTHAGYLAVNKTRQFLYFDSSDEECMVSGQTLKSDNYGHFIPEDPDSFTATKTSQTVGRVHVTDSHFPKDQLQYVDTYPGSETPGTETRGVPAHLYFFVKEVLEATGNTYTPDAILTAIQSNSFGLARIRINI